jgi:hypothetical protein
MRKPIIPNERGCYPQTPPPSRSADADQPCFPERPPGDNDDGCFPESPARRRRRRVDPFDLLDLLDRLSSR